MAWIAEQLMKTINQHMLHECVTYKRLAELSEVDYKQVQASVVVLERNGFVEKIKPGCLRVTQSGMVALESGKATVRTGPKKPKERTRIAKSSRRIDTWRAMRIKGGAFTLSDLIMSVARGDEKDIRINLGKYLSALESAGYLIKLAKRQPGIAPTSNGFARWRLVKDTGPQAPIWRQGLGTVFDPNTGEEIALLPVKRGIY